jgi:ABC-type glycerol-3-phosphate transport system substrate-binding protein
MSKKMSRRELLRLMGAGAGAAVLAGCQPRVVVETVEVEKIVEVEKEVEKTVEVEKIVEQTVEVEKIVEKIVEVTAVPPPKEPEEILFWSTKSSGTELDGIEAMVARFNEENPDIILNHVGYETHDMFNTLLPTAFAGGAPPDIFDNVGFWWLFQLIESGDVLDVSDWYAENRDRYPPGTEAAYTHEGKTYAAPYHLGATNFIYSNVRALTDLGYSVADLDTFENMVEVFEAAGKADQVAIPQGFQGGWNATHWVSCLIDRAVGAQAATDTFFGRNGRRYTDPEIVEAVSHFKDFNDKGYFGIGAASEDYFVAQNRWLGEDLGVMFGLGSWNAGQITGAVDEGLEVEITMFPKMEDKALSETNNWIYWIHLFSAATNRADPQLLLRCLDALGSAEYQQIAFAHTQQLYAAKGATEGTQVHPLLRRLLDLYDDATNLVPVCDITIKSEVTYVMYDELIGILMGQVSVEDAMMHLDEALQESLS